MSRQRNQTTVSGTVNLVNDALVVHTAKGDVSVLLGNITIVRSADEQAAYEKSLHPGLLRDWKGSVSFGFALARGNSDTTDLHTETHLNRKTLNDQISMYESSVYSTNQLTAGGVTANAILGGARYDRNITKRLFAFVSGDFAHDELQGLDLRSIYTGGLGWHAIDRPTTTLNFLAGANYTRETYSGTATTAPVSVQRNLPALTLGQDFQHKFGAITTFTEHAFIYPDLSNTGEYRFSLDANSATKVTHWLAWNLTFNDLFVSNPPIPGTKSNDVIFSTGFSVNFNH